MSAKAQNDPNRKANIHVIPARLLCPCGQRVTVFKGNFYPKAETINVDPPEEDMEMEDMEKDDIESDPSEQRPEVLQVVLCDALRNDENTYALSTNWATGRQEFPQPEPKTDDDPGRFNYIAADFIAALIPQLGGPCTCTCFLKLGGILTSCYSREPTGTDDVSRPTHRARAPSNDSLGDLLTIVSFCLTEKRLLKLCPISQDSSRTTSLVSQTPFLLR